MWVFSLCWLNALALLYERTVSVINLLIWIVKYEVMGRGYVTNSCSIRMVCFPAIRSCHSVFLDFHFTYNPSLVETLTLFGRWWAA
jgi:hypothetical protein